MLKELPKNLRGKFNVKMGWDACLKIKKMQKFEFEIFEPLRGKKVKFKKYSNKLSNF